jgi:anti-sigma factor ChrR (cupin superfamily)
MKKIMMRYLMISCKDATMLTAKKEEGKLSLVERVKLGMHSSMCLLCRKFEKQAHTIAIESKEVTADAELSESAKQRIHEMLSKQTEK